MEAPAHQCQTDVFAVGQMLTSDLGSQTSSGMLSLARVTVLLRIGMLLLAMEGAAIKRRPWLVTSAVRQQNQATPSRTSRSERRW